MRSVPYPPGRSRLLAAGLALALGLPLAACKEVEETASTGYEPSKLESIGGTDVKRVGFTPEAARRAGLRTAPVRRAGRHTAVPYPALIYDPEGTTYVFTSPKPLFFVREEVEVDRIEGNVALLSDGPPVGTKVVTVGALEAYGTELEIASG
jgi:hypothetical protein